MSNANTKIKEVSDQISNLLSLLTQAQALTTNENTPDEISEELKKAHDIIRPLEDSIWELTQKTK